LSAKVVYFFESSAKISDNFAYAGAKISDNFTDARAELSPFPLFKP